jgi:BTB/POZ domain
VQVICKQCVFVIFAKGFKGKTEAHLSRPSATATFLLLKNMSSAKHNFHLKHDAHWHAMSTRFKGMQASRNLVDVTLSCEGRKIAAHKMVLSACSSYFDNIFEVCV